MKLEYRDGLLFTTIKIVYEGKIKEINNIVLDTGATKSLISQEIVDDIGIRVEKKDQIVMSYGIGGQAPAFIKNIDKIVLDKYVCENINIDFSRIDYKDINGLLGLDILINGGFIIDLKQMELKMN
jgi:predicted aspartyl protease